MVTGAEEAEGESAASWRASASPSAGLAVRREEGRELFMLKEVRVGKRGPGLTGTARVGRSRAGAQPERCGDEEQLLESRAGVSGPAAAGGGVCEVQVLRDPSVCSRVSHMRHSRARLGRGGSGERGGLGGRAHGRAAGAWAPSCAENALRSRPRARATPKPYSGSARKKWQIWRS